MQKPDPAIDGTRGGSRGENGRWARARSRRRRAHPRGRSNTAKGDEQIPRTPPADARSATGQAARTCPGAGPERALSEEHQPRMTRAGDVSTAATSEWRRRLASRDRFDHGDARHENRKGDATTGAWVPRVATNAEAGWSGGRQPPDGTARPANVEGMRSEPQERRLSRSVRRREGDGRRIDGAGDQGLPPSRPALESGPPDGGRHRVNAATGEGQRPDARKERKTRRDSHLRTGPRDQRPTAAGKPIRPDGPQGSILRTSRKTPGAQDPRHEPDGPPESAAIL